MNLKIHSFNRSTIHYLSIGFVLLAMIVVALSCNASDVPFDKDRWQRTSDIQTDGGPRGRMLNDLLRKHPLVGLHYRQLTDLLGEPDIIEFGRLDDKKRVSYLIERTYDVIDPDYTKHLVLILNKDSVVEHFTIEEWRK